MPKRSPALDPTPADVATVLDPEWLAEALTDIGPDERIIEVIQLGESETLARKVRFAVEFQNEDGVHRRHGYCVKAHFGASGVETLVTEARFYEQLRPRLDLRAPFAHYVGVAASSGRALIVMDDVEAEGARFLNAHEPYSLEQCRDALAQLARLHAATWADPTWQVDWLAPRVTAMTHAFPRELVQGLLDDGRGVDVPPALLDAWRLQDAMAATALLPPTCVIHGDTHSGNAYLDANGRVCWLDWQVTQQGHWSTDVSYHLGTVLSIEDRREHESELLRGYLDELALQGVTAPAWDDAWDHYTSGFTWGYFLWVITRISSREVVMLHMPRLAAALTDHDTFRRLGVS